MMSRSRRSRLVLLGAVLLGAAGLLFSHSASQFINIRRAQKHAAGGEILYARGDFAAALEKAERGLKIRRIDRRCLRLAGFSATALGRSDALEYCNRILQSPQASVQDHLEYARSALTLKQPGLARERLTPLLAKPNPSVEMLRLGSLCAGQLGENATAVRLARLALDQEPSAVQLRLLLAQHLATEGGAACIQEGKEILLEIARQTTEARNAAIELLWSSFPLSSEECEELLRCLRTPGKAWAAHPLRELDLRLKASPGTRAEILHESLARYREGGEAEQLAFCRWLNQNREYSLTTNFLDERKGAKGQDFLLVYLDALAGLNNWTEIDAVLASEDLPLPDLVRELYRARAAQELNHQRLAPLHWTRAHRMASRDPQQLWYAAVYAEKAGEPAEAIRMYRHLTEVPAMASAAYQRLLSLMESGPTVELRDLLRAMVRAFPENEAARNDLAYLNLLLDQEVETSREAALKLFARHPTFLSYRTTLALVHYRTGNVVEAARLYKDINVDWTRVAPGWKAVQMAVLTAAGESPQATLAGPEIEKLRMEEKALLGPSSEKGNVLRGRRTEPILSR